MVPVAKLEYLCRMTACNSQRWNVLHHDASRLYDGTFAYSYAAKDANVQSNPDITANFDIPYLEIIVIWQFCTLIIVRFGEDNKTFA